MIILVTCASHTGKTMLAQKMLKKYGYPYLSIDHLKMGLIRSGNTGLALEDDDALTEYLWPIVREMVIDDDYEETIEALLQELISYVIGVLKSIRKQLGKKDGDLIHVVITER